MARKTSCIAGAWPRISGVSAPPAAPRRWRRRLVRRAADQLHRVVDVEGLRQVFEGAALERRDRAVEIRVRGHDDHRDVRIALLHLAAAARGPTRPACGCRTPAPAARSPRSACSTSYAARTSCTGCPRARAPSRAPSGSSGRRRRSRRPSCRRRAAVRSRRRTSSRSFPFMRRLVRIVSSGSRMVKIVLPGTLSHSIVPLCWATKVCAIVSPRPLPPSRPDTSG